MANKEQKLKSNLERIAYILGESSFMGIVIGGAIAENMPYRIFIIGGGLLFSAICFVIGTYFNIHNNID
ncbi:hypothetical protein AGMMS4956_03340 [Bacteroidia bacterium]|nr:hypothetical protein AGMMS4956_03340 [Bacteroidia bacterium]